jgi:hypothetical protein
MKLVMKIIYKKTGNVRNYVTLMRVLLTIVAVKGNKCYIVQKI